MKIDGVKITAGFQFDEAELKNYVKYVKERVPNVSVIEVTLCEDGLVDVSYIARGEKFERIRRITGYLVGTIDRWNDSKQAEEHDRVKHDTRGFEQ